MRRASLFLGVLLPFLALPLVPCARAGQIPYPAGRSTQQIEGLAVDLVLPADLTPEKKVSLVFILHGSGGTASGMSGSFMGWAQDGYVVCAPQATTNDWTPDMPKVHRIFAHLREVLPIDPKKVHVVGFSNGGWHLQEIAFDDEFHPCSATWLAAGFKGGSVPKWAKTDLGAMAIAGSEDPNLGAAKATVAALQGKVRNVEFHVQEGIGHAFPEKWMPYLQWWMGVQEGRLERGDDRSFDWKDDLAAALQSQANVKKGGVMLWLFGPEDDEEPTRILQDEVFFDPAVRFLGGQIPCVRLNAKDHADVLAEYKVKSTPAIVVLDKAGKVKKVYEGKIKAKHLAGTLGHVAPERRMPKD